jgi:hypothetical protein
VVRWRLLAEKSHDTGNRASSTIARVARSEPSEALFPDLGISALMKNSQNGNGILFPEEVNRVRKLVEQSSSNPFADHGKLKRSRLDPIEKRAELAGQTVA